MNRLSWDTTAPRRLTGKRSSANPRPETAVETEAELIHVAWDKPPRISPFSAALSRPDTREPGSNDVRTRFAAVPPR